MRRAENTPLPNLFFCATMPANNQISMNNSEMPNNAKFVVGAVDGEPTPDFLKMEVSGEDVEVKRHSIPPHTFDEMRAYAKKLRGSNEVPDRLDELLKQYGLVISEYDPDAQAEIELGDGEIITVSLYKDRFLEPYFDVSVEKEALF